MNRNNFLQSLVLLGASSYLVNDQIFTAMKKTDSVRLLRHATLVITINNLKLLVDPMLSAQSEMDPVANCGNDTRIPMTELPVDKNALSKIIEEADAVVITHTHRDHWDAAAQKLIDKNKFIICQPADTEKIKELGFLNVHAVKDKLDWKGITISRTGGQHGTGEIGKAMGTVSGFVFAKGRKSIYVAGDTIWCDEVKVALDAHKPDYTVLNAGAAKFLTGDPITMTPSDIISVYKHRPKTKIIAVHMDTVNHCFVKRADLKKALQENKLEQKVMIPADGETIDL